MFIIFLNLRCLQWVQDISSMLFWNPSSGRSLISEAFLLDTLALQGISSSIFRSPPFPSPNGSQGTEARPLSGARRQVSLLHFRGCGLRCAVLLDRTSVAEPPGRSGWTEEGCLGRRSGERSTTCDRPTGKACPP